MHLQLGGLQVMMWLQNMPNKPGQYPNETLRHGLRSGVRHAHCPVLMTDVFLIFHVTA